MTGFGQTVDFYLATEKEVHKHEHFNNFSKAGKNFQFTSN